MTTPSSSRQRESGGVEPGAGYPRIVEGRGDAPPQYG